MIVLKCFSFVFQTSGMECYDFANKVSAHSVTKNRLLISFITKVNNNQF